MVRRPPRPLARSAMPFKPVPAVSIEAPPIPSSRISSVSARPSQFIDTSTRVAPACLTALVSASAIRKYALASTHSGRRSGMAAETLTGSGERRASALIAAGSSRLVRIDG